MHIVRVLLVRASETQGCPAADKTWALFLGQRLIETGSNFLHVVAVTALDKPTVCFVPLRNRLGEALVGLSSERDLVVIVEIDEVIELHVPRQGGRLCGNTLHQISIAHERVHTIIKEVRAVTSRQHLARERQTNCI